MHLPKGRKSKSFSSMLFALVAAILQTREDVGMAEDAQG